MKTVPIPVGSISFVDRGAGTPVLLVHGFPLDHTMWASQIDALGGSARVIAPDLRGFGETPLAAGDEQRGITMEQFADDLAELLDALAINEPVILVGFSMGGYVALQFVRKYAARVRGLVLCDTRAVADTEEARAGRLKMAANVAEWGSGRVAEIMGPKLFAAESFEKRPEAVSHVRDVVKRTAPASIAAAQRGMAARPDMTGYLSQIKAPTLVLVGEKDAISPAEEMKAVAAAIDGAEYIVVPGTGHMTTMENPDAVNAALVKFITGLGAGG